MSLLTWGPRCELLSQTAGEPGPSWCKRFVEEPAGLSLNDFSVHVQLGNSHGAFFQMWNLSAKWSQLKCQLRLELAFSFCWLYPPLLLPDRVSLCLSQTCRLLKVFILCFGCVDLCVAKFRCPSHSQPQQWSKMLKGDRSRSLRFFSCYSSIRNL